MKTLFDTNLHLTGKVLDMRLMRQNVVMSNLANMTTPKYTARRLEFEKDLQSALNLDARGKMTRTEGQHMPSVFTSDSFSPEMEKNLRHRVIPGEDNVDLDKEMAVILKTRWMYNALTTVLKHKFEGLKTVIGEGSR